MSTDWQLTNDEDATVEDQLVDVVVVDAFNRFARRAEVWIDDEDGSKLAEYTKFTPVTLAAKRNTDPSFTDRFGGFIIDPRSEDGLLHAHILSHDYWLRRRQVFKDYTAQAKSAILQDLIETLTPLAWNPALVDVQNDDPITRTWRGESLDEVIDEISNQSGDEEWGANNDQEFFFRPTSTTTSPRDLTDGEWISNDFENDGRVEINRVTLYFGTGGSTGAIAVNDQDAQLDLQDRLGAARPVVIGFTTTYPEIDNEDAAIAKAQSILERGTAIQVGRVTTWDLFDANPGDVITFADPEKGINTTFRIAEIEYIWRRDETLVTIAENRAGVVDVLVSLSDEVTRIDNRDADTDAAIVEILNVEVGDTVTVAGFEVIKRDVQAGFFRFGEPGEEIGGSNVGGKLGIGLGAPTVLHTEGDL